MNADTASVATTQNSDHLPNHLKDLAKRRAAASQKTTSTTHYGFIDSHPTATTSADDCDSAISRRLSAVYLNHSKTPSETASNATGLATFYSDYVLKKGLVTSFQHHDSGVDSMNTNSSGSVVMSSRTSPTSEASVASSSGNYRLRSPNGKTQDGERLLFSTN